MSKKNFKPPRITFFSSQLFILEDVTWEKIFQMEKPGSNQDLKQAIAIQNNKFEWKKM